MSLFLTPDELRDLTGYKYRARQIAWLRAHRYRFSLNAKGKIIIHRDHVGDRLGAGKPPEPEPDFSVFGKAG